MELNGFILKFSTVEEVGCFRENAKHRAFPMMLKNMRRGIDWHHLEKIVQKCALLTKENNYKVRCSNNRLVLWESLVTSINYACVTFLAKIEASRAGDKN